MVNENDELRVKLMEAEARILALEREVAKLCKNLVNGTPKHKDSPRQVRFSHKLLSEKQLKVFNLIEGTCFYCACAITHEEFTCDHLIPASKGGSHRITNLVPACSKCNGKKGNRMPLQSETEYATYLHNRCKKK